MSTGKASSSMAQGPPAKVQQQQKQKQKVKVNNNIPAAAMTRNNTRANRGAEFEAVPEWKLNCLCTDYGIPPTMRGGLHMGGCSF